MKKKWVLLSVMFAFFFAISGLSARAEEASYSYPPKSEWTDAKYFEFDASTGTITGYGGGPKDVVIPAKINGVAVLHIGAWAFYKNQLTQVSLPQGLTSIGNYAFYDNKLTQVSLPKGLTSIGAVAFNHNKLTEVSLPQGLTSIGKEAFSENQLTQVSLPKGLTSIGYRAFAYNKLTEVSFPQGLTSIGGYAFNSNQLTEVSFPESLTSIEYGAFNSNQLTQVSFPENLTYIGEEAFTKNKLKEVEVSEACNVDSKAFDEGVKIIRRGGGLKNITEENLFAEKVISDPKYSWTVTFDKELDISTVSAGNFFIQDKDGNILKGIEPTLIDETKVRFVNNTAFEMNKDYYLVVKKGVLGKNSKLKNTVILKFRVQ